MAVSETLVEWGDENLMEELKKNTCAKKDSLSAKRLAMALGLVTEPGFKKSGTSHFAAKKAKKKSLGRELVELATILGIVAIKAKLEEERQRRPEVLLQKAVEEAQAKIKIINILADAVYPEPHVSSPTIETRDEAKQSIASLPAAKEPPKKKREKTLKKTRNILADYISQVRLGENDRDARKAVEIKLLKKEPERGAEDIRRSVLRVVQKYYQSGSTTLT
ncbi:MAG: hypothetical protein WCD76_22355 [Pyrinomonadaceae bacterium]